MLCIGTDLVALWADTPDAFPTSPGSVYESDSNDNRILPIQGRFSSKLPVHSHKRSPPLVL